MTTTLNASTAGAGGFIATSDNSGVLALQTAGTTAITVDTSQRVGIGITSPSAPLNVQAQATGGLAIRLNGRSSDNYSELGFYNNANSTNYGILGVDQSAMYFGTNASLPVTFTTGSTERMRIDSSGNLLVGTTSSTPAGSGDTKGISLWTNGSSSQIFSTGNGDTAAVFNRAGSDGALIRTRRQGSDVGSISVTASATAYNTSSDYRLKDNVQPMAGALSKVALLKPVTYKWKVDGSDGEGFIAHELAEVKPDCVSGDKDAVDADGNPRYQGIDTSFLIATLTAAIQEQQATINAQSAALAALTARIVALEGK